MQQIFKPVEVQHEGDARVRGDGPGRQHGGSEGGRVAYEARERGQCMAREERGHVREVCVQRKAAGGREAAKTDTHEDDK